MKAIHQVNRIYRNLSSKKVFGVCSGLARYAGTETWIVRTVAVVALLTLPVLTAMAYLAAGLLLPGRRFL